MTLRQREFSHSIRHETNQGRPSVDFFFVDHAPENRRRVFDAVRETNPDVVAIELAGRPQEVKDQVAEEITHMLRRGYELDPAELAQYSPFVETVIRALKNTDATVQFIDVDDSYAERIVAAQRHYASWESSHTEGVGTLHQTLIETSRLHKEREECVVGQINDLRHQYKDARIAVVLGAMHTPVFHKLSRNGNVSRQFISSLNDEARLARGERFRYDSIHATERSVRFGAKVTKMQRHE